MKPLLALAVFAGVLAGAESPSAETLLTEAKTQAAAEHKSVFLIFHASWCGWCHKLDSFIGSDGIKPVFDKYFVIARVTVQERGDKQALNNPGGDALLKRVGGDGGLPYFAFLNSGGELIVNSTEPGKGNIGHPSEPHEVDWFLAMLRKAATGISADEVAPLEKYLRAQKK
jgi:hypothetical protein